MSACCLQAEQSTVETLRQQVQAQEAQLSAAQQELAATKELAETKNRHNSQLAGHKAKLWQALVADTPLAGAVATRVVMKQITEAVELHQAKMARLRALEASSAVRHLIWIVRQTASVPKLPQRSKQICTAADEALKNLCLPQGESAQAARITELEQKVTDLGKQLASKAAEAKTAVGAMKPMKEQNDQVLGFLTKAQAKVASLKGELEAAQRDAEAAHAKAKRCDADIERLQAANSQMEEEKQRLQADVEELRTANLRLQQRVQVLTACAATELHAQACKSAAVVWSFK